MLDDSLIMGGCGSSATPSPGLVPYRAEELRFDGVPGIFEPGLLSDLGKGEEGRNIEAAFAIGGCDEKEVLSGDAVAEFVMSLLVPALARRACVRFEAGF